MSSAPPILRMLMSKGGRNVSWIRARVLHTEATACGYLRARSDLGVMRKEGYGVHIDRLTADSFYLQAIKGD